VARKFLDELDGQPRREEGSSSRSAPRRIDWFVEHGYDKAMGARPPMARLVQTRSRGPLANEILFGKARSTVRTAVAPILARSR